jgi:hypothetical protein
MDSYQNSIAFLMVLISKNCGLRTTMTDVTPDNYTPLNFFILPRKIGIELLIIDPQPNPYAPLPQIDFNLVYLIPKSSSDNNISNYNKHERI